MNIANIITLTRIAFLPLIIVLVMQENPVAAGWAVIFFTLAILTDIIDGYVARKRAEITRIGSFLDPFADKILVMGLLLVFVVQGKFFITPFVFLLLRDVIVGVIRWLASQDDIVIPEENFRKQLIYTQYGIIYGLLFRDFFFHSLAFEYVPWAEWFVFIFTAVALVLATASMIYHAVLYGKSAHQHWKESKKVEAGKIVILANRKSSGFHDRYRRHLLRLFSKRREAELHYLPFAPDMYQHTEKIVDTADHLIIAGGDGSFESALNYRPFWKKKLGFFPLGAGNAYYSYFYKGKRFEYLRSRFHFSEGLMDVLELEWDHHKIQTTFIAVGIDAEVVRWQKGQQRGFSGYLASSLRTVLQSKSGYDLSCSIDGKKHHFPNCVNFTLGKIPYYGFALRSLLGRVLPDDGLVYATTVVNIHSHFLNKAVRFWGLILGLLNIDKPPLISLRGKEIVLKSKTPFSLQAGGDFLGFTDHLKVRVVRKQKVLVI